MTEEHNFIAKVTADIQEAIIITPDAVYFAGEAGEAIRTISRTQYYAIREVLRTAKM